MEEKEVRFTLRVPKALYDRLVKDAEREKRSVNNQILYTLERAIVWKLS